jgi:hypothetical protein
MHLQFGKEINIKYSVIPRLTPFCNTAVWNKTKYVKENERITSTMLKMFSEFLNSNVWGIKLDNPFEILKQSAPKEEERPMPGPNYRTMTISKPTEGSDPLQLAASCLMTLIRKSREQQPPDNEL